MKKTITIFGLAIAGLAVLLSAPALGADVTSETVDLDDPNNESIEVDVSYSSSYAGSTVAVVLEESDGTELINQTTTGSADSTGTVTLDPSGLNPDTSKTLRIKSPSGNEADISVSETRIIRTISNVTTVETGNESTDISVDIGFDSASKTNATVRALDSNGTELTNESVIFDPVETDGTEGIETTTLTINETQSNQTVTVETTVSPASGYSSVHAEEDQSLFSGVFGLENTSDTQLLFVGAGALILILLLGRDD